MNTKIAFRSRRFAGLLLLSMSCAFFAPHLQAQNGSATPLRSRPLPARPVIENVVSSNDASTLTIEAEFQPRSWIFHRVFLDTDNNPATGFSVGTIQNGAEFLVEGAFLYRYTGTGRDWSWQPSGTVPFELGARSVRWRIDRAAIGETTSPNLTAFRVHLEADALAEAHSGIYLHQYPWDTSPTAQQLGIPAYIWSGDTVAWQRLLASDPLTLDLLVFGIANGPGTARIPQQASYVDTARQQGRKVLGYVYTQAGGRSLAEVLGDIDRYYSWYHVNGIFVDQGDYTCDHVQYYSAIRAHVLGKGADQHVVLNPGRVFEECMMPTADVFMGFETDATTYLNTPTSWVLPPFADKYPRSRFWHVVHSATPAQLGAVVARSKQLHVGRVWVTPDVLPNPYDTFPDAAFYNTLVQQATERPAAAPGAFRPTVPPKRRRGSPALDARR